MEVASPVEGPFPSVLALGRIEVPFEDTLGMPLAEGKLGRGTGRKAESEERMPTVGCSFALEVAALSFGAMGCSSSSEVVFAARDRCRS